MNGSRLGIRKELILALVAIILLSGIFTHLIIFAFSRHSFDTLVRKSDIAIAESIADHLVPWYRAHGSWEGVGAEVQAMQVDLLSRLSLSAEPRGPHERGGGLPLVITDARGSPVHAPDGGGGPTETSRERYKTHDGVPVLVGKESVGYVFFKSMLKRSYNEREASFFTSMVFSILMSLAVGVLLAVILGSLFAIRFLRPILNLDQAVTRLANGDYRVAAPGSRQDEIGRLADNFNEMARKIQMTEAARKSMLADVAHELRTPVSIIQANLEMILDGVYEADRERLQSLYDETRILTDLVSSLREISDLENGVTTFTLEPVRVYPLLVETCRAATPLFEERGMKMVLEPFPDESLSVTSDQNRLRQVIRNILLNARKYAPERSAVTISGEILREGKKPLLRIRIADEGPGVPENLLGKIFDRFYRVDSSRSRDSGGRGLGLAISKQCIEASGGSIRAENRSPQGLVIIFDLVICETART